MRSARTCTISCARTSKPPSLHAIGTIVDLASIDYDPGQTWGDLHRLNIAHPLANVLVIGSRYTFENLPSPGTTTTIHKAAHSVTADRHQVTFSANARLICDMSSPDANTVVLPGPGRPLGSPTCSTRSRSAAAT